VERAVRSLVEEPIGKMLVTGELREGQCVQLSAEDGVIKLLVK
jgi:hypothetical protein